jgi:hypothetical protein
MDILDVRVCQFTLFVFSGENSTQLIM